MTKAALARRSYVALVHHPVLDKNDKVVTTSITNLDIHDIARSSRTYGLAGYFIVHPVAAQRELAARIIGHWQDGPGQEQNDFRRDALSLVRVVSAISEVVEEVTNKHGRKPKLVGTTARHYPASVTASRLVAESLLPEQQDQPVLLILGTGWGLTEEFLSQVDRLLYPVRGTTQYNHLSVRSAAGIIFDRLFAEPEPVSGEQRP